MEKNQPQGPSWREAVQTVFSAHQLLRTRNQPPGTSTVPQRTLPRTVRLKSENALLSQKGQIELKQATPAQKIISLKVSTIFHIFFFILLIKSTELWEPALLKAGSGKAKTKEKQRSLSKVNIRKNLCTRKKSQIDLSGIAVNLTTPNKT